MESFGLLLSVTFISFCVLVAGSEDQLIRCPFNPHHCECVPQSGSKFDFISSVCNATNGIPQFEKAVRLYYVSEMILAGNVVEIGKNAFAAFGSFSTLSLEQTGARQDHRWDPDAFRGITVLKLRITNVGGLIPAPEALKPVLDARMRPYLSITEGGDVSLERAAFANLPELTSLRIERTRISKIDRYAFNGTNRLSSLFLISTSLTQFPQEALESLPYLGVLGLSGNKFTGAAVPGLRFLPRTLHAFELDNNGLTAIPTELLSTANLVSFSSLSLADNNISSVNSKDFPKFPALRSLDLSGNPITKIDLRFGLPTLRWLWLKRTKLTSIDFASLGDWRGSFDLDISDSPDLKSVSMSGRKLGTYDYRLINLTNTGLERIDRSVLDKGGSFTLVIDHNEHLLCDEEMKWIVRRVVYRPSPFNHNLLYIGDSVCADKNISLARYILDDVKDLPRKDKWLHRIYLSTMNGPSRWTLDDFARENKLE